jgi:hypothetical protein
MAVTGLNPYDLAKLLSGPCRVVYRAAPASFTFAPKRLADLMNQEHPYSLIDSWHDFGQTTPDGGQYGRAITTSGFQIDQATGDVATSVTDTTRTITATFAQLDSTLLQIMEQSASIDTIASASGEPAAKQVKFGTIDSLTNYAIALIGRRPKGQGADITEADGVVRGALVAAVLYNCEITGDSAAIQVARANLAACQLTFQAYPLSGTSQGQEHGFWEEETGPATITGS